MIASRTTFCCGLSGQVTGTTESTIYKTTQDLTDTDYLTICGMYAQTAAAGDIKIYFDTTLKLTIPVSGNFTKDDIFNERIDCTAISGEQIIKVNIVNDNAGGITHVKDISIFSEET